VPLLGQCVIWDEALHLNFRNINSRLASLYTRYLMSLFQDPWKTTLLLKAKNELKKKEEDEDDLT
jgi:hypothetical protein